MLPQQIVVLWTYLRSRTRAAGGWNEAGTVVEKVILTAVFAALAIAVGAIGALARKKLFWFVSLGFGAVGMVFFVMGLI